MKQLIFVISLACIGYAAPAFAQGHPCDTTPAAVDVRPGVAFGVGFCVAAKDAEGNPITYTGFKITLDATQLPSQTLSPIGAPSTSGQLYFETPKTLTVAGAGSHSVSIIATNPGGDSNPSVPLSFAARVLPPSQPTNQRIVK